jgi:hypothetical protein
MRSTTERASHDVALFAYLRDVVWWSAFWLFALCYAVTVWRLGAWLAG